MVTEWQMPGYERLRIAIVKSAVCDYKRALRMSARLGKKCKKEVELERFFLSPWGQALSGDNGEYIMELCRKEFRNKTIHRGRAALPDEKIEELVKEYIRGAKQQELADKYKISTATVGKYIERWS